VTKMSFRAGQTFLYPLTAAEKPHLWVIATDPDAETQFAVVSFTTLRGSKDQTVLIIPSFAGTPVSPTCWRKSSASNSCRTG
jgi:hypothetical protein